MEPKKAGLTKLSRGLIAGVGSLILVGGGLLGGYQLAKVKPPIKVVNSIVPTIVPTVLPTASPSATLVPTRVLPRSIGGQGVTAPVVTVKPTVALHK